MKILVTTQQQYLLHYKTENPVIYHQNLQNDEKGNYKPKIVETTGEIAESICDEQTKGNTGHLICICVL